MVFSENDLSSLTKEKLKDILRVMKIKGVSTFNKTKLVKKIMDEQDKGNMANYEANQTIAEIRKALGLTNNPLASRTKGVRKTKVDDAKEAKAFADEALGLVRKAMKTIGRKPKLSKQFKQRILKEIEDFEDEIDKITQK